MTGSVPEVSVVICTRNRADMIRRAVASVLSNDHPSFEVVVIDQSDTSDTRSAIADLIDADSRLSYVHTTKVGLSAAYNSGIAATSGPVLAFTDDDCVAPSDWLSNIVKAFEANPDSSLMYGQVLVPAGLASAEGIVPNLMFTKRRKIGGPGRAFEVYGMGANFAARRPLFVGLGGFDEVLGGGGPLRSSQDFDLQYRADRAGYTTLLEPTVQVDHYGLRTREQWPQTEVAYGIGDGAFYMKHARCGDGRAIRILGQRIAGQAVRVAMKPLVGRPQHSPNYLKGMLQGSRGSFRFRVDRGRRMYVAKS